MTRVHLGYVHNEEKVEVVEEGDDKDSYVEIATVRVITEHDRIRIRIERVDSTVPVLFEVP